MTLNNLISSSLNKDSFKFISFQNLISIHFPELFWGIIPDLILPFQCILIILDLHLFQIICFIPEIPILLIYWHKIWWLINMKVRLEMHDWLLILMEMNHIAGGFDHASLQILLRKYLRLINYLRRALIYGTLYITYLLIVVNRLWTMRIQLNFSPLNMKSILIMTVIQRQLWHHLYDLLFIILQGFTESDLIRLILHYLNLLTGRRLFPVLILLNFWTLSFYSIIILNLHSPHPPQHPPNLLSRKPPIMIIYQHTHQQLPHSPTETPLVLYTLRLHLIKVLLHVHPRIYCRPVQHLVQNHSQSPNVALFRVFILLKCLWWHVLWRSDVIVYLRTVGNALFCTVSEINHAQFILTAIHTIIIPRLAKYEVIRFQITMYNSLVFNHNICLKNLNEQSNRLTFTQSLRTLSDIIS